MAQHTWWVVVVGKSIFGVFGAALRDAADREAADLNTRIPAFAHAEVTSVTATWDRRPRVGGRLSEAAR